jgi:hypothetical protein
MTTLIFVDVDGVLNVAVADPGKSSLSLDPQNVMIALKKAQKKSTCDSAQRLVATYFHDLDHGEMGPVGMFSNHDGVGVCSEFARRLAGLMRIAGRCTVVLSSSWRLPVHDSRVRRLERMVSSHLGAPFRFADRTAFAPERGPGDRLALIGDYMADFCERSDVSHLRALVLDDLFVTPMGGWDCDGFEMDSVCSAERYLRERVPAPTTAEVCLLHTYKEFVAPGGLMVQIGVGLTSQHICKALKFFNTLCPHCVQN